MTTKDEMPAEAQRLSAFLGVWQVDGSLDAGDGSMPIAGRWSFEAVADGWGVQGSMSTAIEGMGEFSERELIGFDPAERLVHMFSMNQYAVRDHVGDWTVDDTLVVTYHGSVNDQDIVEEITVRFVVPGRIEAGVVERADDTVTVTTQLAMTRVD